MCVVLTTVTLACGFLKHQGSVMQLFIHRGELIRELSAGWGTVGTPSCMEDSPVSGSAVYHLNSENYITVATTSWLPVVRARQFTILAFHCHSENEGHELNVSPECLHTSRSPTRAFSLAVNPRRLGPEATVCCCLSSDLWIDGFRCLTV